MSKIKCFVVICNANVFYKIKVKLVIVYKVYFGQMYFDKIQYF